MILRRIGMRASILMTLVTQDLVGFPGKVMVFSQGISGTTWHGPWGVKHARNALVVIMFLTRGWDQFLARIENLVRLT